MEEDYRSKLNQFYYQKGIHPLSFKCKHNQNCRQFANNGQMTETKMSMVGSKYGILYPKITVISLDPPSGIRTDGNSRWQFTTPMERTTDSVSLTHEKDNYNIDRPNPHWAMTQIIIKEILALWGYKANHNSAVVLESYSGRHIENVSAYFAHVNVAKCSMNNEGQRQANSFVHNTCSQSYLLKELTLLEPDILITQGATTNKILGKMFIDREISVSELPLSKILNFGSNKCLWLPMHHPTQQINKIRNAWPYYLMAIKNWKK
jgi:hypothetical protein